MRRFVIVVLLVCMLSTPWAPVIGQGVDRTMAQGTQPSTVPAVDMEVVRVHLRFGDVTVAEMEGEGRGYSMLQLEGATGSLMAPGSPVLPLHGDMLTLPINSVVHEVTLEDAVHYTLLTEDRVVPSPEPIPLTFGSEPVPLYEGDAYTTDSLFPAVELEHRVTTGRGTWGGIEAHVFVSVYPLRYNPVSGIVTGLEEADLVIRYTPPAVEPFRSRDPNETYQVLVLCPEEFFNETQRYKEHKEALGWSVKVVALEKVYDNSIFNTTGARDNPERIKYFIKQAIENWTVEHVLLVGDSEKLPIRYTRIEDGADGTTTPSDFYYGDIFDAGTTNLSDWNYDNDGYWGESRSSSTNADRCDLDPDVSVGRFPVSTVTELETMINKTIMYHENVTQDDAVEWFQNASFAGTDTFGSSSGGVFEGEFALNMAQQYFTEFNVTKFYQSTGTFNRDAIEAYLNKGAGWAAWSDHGNTGGVVWTSGGYGPGLSSTVAGRLTNGHKLFLSIQDACLTNRFDSSDSLGEHIVLNPDGGGIGAIGMTRIGWGMWDQWHVQRLSGYMGVHHHEAFSTGVIMPGDMLDWTRRSYMEDNGGLYVSDMKTLLGYALLGDPIVYIGGPGVSFESNDTEVWAAPGDEVVFNVTVRNKALHDDTLNISIAGGDWQWAHDLDEGEVQMVSNDTVSLNLSVKVDDRALAYSSDSATLSVGTLSVPFPIEQSFTVHVIEVRSVDILVNATEYEAMPGENVTIEYNISNQGNILENATVWLHGEHEGWDVNITTDGILIDAWQGHDGNVTFAVPEGLLAGKYYFELRIWTENGTERAFFIKVEVGQVHGVDAWLVEDPVTAERTTQGLEARFEVVVENLGNHKDMLHSEVVAGEEDGWEVTISREDVVIMAFDNRTLAVDVDMPFEVLEGQYCITIAVSSASDPAESVDVDLHLDVPMWSGLDLVPVSASEADVRNGFALFDLRIGSASNFEEVVELTVEGLPDGWTWEKDVGTITVDPFHQTPFSMSFTPPADVTGGRYTVQVTADGGHSDDTITLTIIVPTEREVSMTVDRTTAAVLSGEGTTFELTVSNLGNVEDTFILVPAETAGLMVALDATLVTMAQGADPSKVELSVDVPAGTPKGKREVTVDAFSTMDRTVKATVTVELQIEVRFVPAPDLRVVGGGQARLYQGDSTTFTVTLLNLGNVEEFVSLYDSSGHPLTVTMPSNATLAPGGETDITITVLAAEDAVPSQYTFKAFANSTQGQQEVAFTISVLKRPVEEETPGTNAIESGGMLPLALIVIIVILTILLIAAIATRRRKGEDDGIPAPPPGPSAGYEAATTTEPPEKGGEVGDGGEGDGGGKDEEDGPKGEVEGQEGKEEEKEAGEEGEDDGGPKREGPETPAPEEGKDPSAPPTA